MKAILSLFLICYVGHVMGNPQFIERWTTISDTTFNYNLELLRSVLNINNNSFNLQNYFYYFYGNTNWTDVDKVNLLACIPSNGLRIRTYYNLTPFNFSSYFFNISVYNQNYGYLSIPKSFLDLVLNGNQVNRTYSWADININAISYMGITMGFRYPIIKYRNIIKNLFCGVQLHYQQGLLTTITDTAYGIITTTPDDLRAHLFLSQKIARNGNCLAGDCFFALEFNHNINLVLAFLNLSTGFYWQENCQEFLYEIAIDSFNLSYFWENPVADSFFNFTHQAGPCAPFKTVLPPQIFLCCDAILTKHIKCLMYYHRYLDYSIFIRDFLHQLNFTIHYTPIKPISLNLSFTVDFHRNFYFIPGFKLSIRRFYLKLATPQYNGVLSKSKGLSLCVSSGVYF